MKDTPGVILHVRGVVILPGGSGAAVLLEEREMMVVGNSKRLQTPQMFFNGETGRKKADYIHITKYYVKRNEENPCTLTWRVGSSIC